MKSLKTLERLQQLHQRISQENTGTPKELASFMNISERSLYKLIEQLKDLTAPISYNRIINTYYYDGDFELQINISVTALSNNEKIQVFGGSYFLKKNTLLQGLCSGRLYIS
ncbi:MAG: HTH domain-containing protein [Flavobacteriales bacterium]|nr:HTH domain-containing protein [Flavobacteriales bacterium]PIV95113.1 MAG: DNA-binding protein [Flavobacteriaceae bacterium CG17_big_fil_post_rev_8_21_14_2_50_33_15]PIY13490.1 MAG: DNA-binding protein [Flavobacteriaceae bacterium CG_4_10_14_3_um_filter_33_47]PJB18188.1 MAG: DNA-binding protein [Flavobacteriaceae bacterium CG_4_9_14_3_um_filter_33_16]NCQ15166.1 HTH domain-containing protein [Flavobacteriales bacterium]